MVKMVQSSPVPLLPGKFLDKKGGRPLKSLPHETLIHEEMMFVEKYVPPNDTPMLPVIPFL